MTRAASRLSAPAGAVRAWGMAVLLAASSAAGCTSQDSPDPAAPAVTPTSTAPSTSPEPEPDPDVHDCTLFARNDSNAVDYVGPGPHLAEVYRTSDRTGPVADDPVLPGEWDASLVSYADPDPDAEPRTALIICVGKVQIASNVPIGKCQDDIEGPVPLPTFPGDEADPPDYTVGVYPAIQFFTVITAKTGKVLARFSLRGDDTADHSCPYSSEDMSDGTKVARGIKPQTFADRVRPFVTATVR
jgi:hypothetical protein